MDMVTLPEPDMETLDETNLRTSYAKLFRYIEGDFVTKRDLEIILATLTTPPGGGKVVYVPTYEVGKALIGVYEGLVRVGKAATKGAIAAAKAAIGL